MTRLWFDEHLFGESITMWWVGGLKAQGYNFWYFKANSYLGCNFLQFSNFLQVIKCS